MTLLLLEIIHYSSFIITSFILLEIFSYNLAAILSYPIERHSTTKITFQSELNFFITMFTNELFAHNHCSINSDLQVPELPETYWGNGEASKDSNEIKPFKINVSEEVIFQHQYEIVIINIYWHYMFFQLFIICR